MPVTYTDAVVRDVTDKFGEHPSILDWGTSTSTDFTAAFQAALDNRGGGVIFFPRTATGTYSFSAVTIPNNTILRGEAGVTFARLGTAVEGTGWLNVTGSNVRVENIKFDGAITTATGLIYGTGTSSVLFNNDPEDAKLTKSSTFWLQPGADNFVMDGCEINHTSGYAVFVDVQTGDTRNVKVLNSTFKNNRPNLFGTSTATMNVGGWNSGIFVGGSCTGTNTFYLDGLTVDNCTFERNSGNQIWSHSKGFDVHHRNFTISNNRFQNIGLDCIQPGNVVNVAEFGNVCENVGFITETDVDTPVARVITAAYAVAIDHSGFVDNVSCTNNTVKEVMGGAIDGDGIRNGVIANNTLYTSQSIGKGIQPGNTSANGGATNIKISNNYIEGFTNGAIVLSEGVGITVEHNRIVHPGTAAYPPISIYSPIATPYNNVIRFNHIDYDAANWCIIEDEAGGTPWGTGNINSVYGNILSGTNLGEFYSAAASSSLTGQYFPSNAGTLTSRNDYYVQTEGEGATTAHKWYHVTTTSAIQQMDLLLQRTSGTNDPLLRIGTASGQGCYTSGGRATLGLGDLVYTGKTLTAGFGAILGKTAAGNNYVSTEADALGTAWAKIRFDETVPAIQFSTAMTGGTCDWFNLSTGGGAPGGTLGNIQYFGTGTVLAGDPAWTFNDTTKQVTLAGGTATNAAFIVSTGYINSAGGLLSTSTAVNAIQAPSGGITGKYLIPTASLIITGTTTTAAGLSGAGQGSLMFNSVTNRFMYSENGTAYANAFGGAANVLPFTLNSGSGWVGLNNPSPTVTFDVIMATNTTTDDMIFTKDAWWNTVSFAAYSGGGVNHSPQFKLKRARGSNASPTTVNNGDQVGGFFFAGHDGANFMQAAAVSAFVDGSPSSGNVPLYLSFQLGSNSSAPEKFSMHNDGRLLVNATADDSSGAKLQVTGFVSASTGYYSANNSSSTVNIPSGGVTALSHISVRNDGGACFALSRTSSVARDFSLRISTSGAFQILDDTSGNAKISIFTSGETRINTGDFNIHTGSLQMGGSTVINTSAQFVGGGVNCNAGVGATGFNIYGGSYFGVAGPTTFTTTDGKTVTVRGGIITSIV